MSGEGQFREQAKKLGEKLDAEGRKIINDLLVADKDGTAWLENTEPKFTGKKGTKLIKVAFDTKTKKYTHAYEEKEEVPVEEAIRLDIPPQGLLHLLQLPQHKKHKTTKHKKRVNDRHTQQVGARHQIHRNCTLLSLDSRKKHYSECVSLIRNQNHTQPEATYKKPSRMHLRKKHCRKKLPSKNATLSW